MACLMMFYTSKQEWLVLCCKAKLVSYSLVLTDLSDPIRCDPRNHAYKNGKTFEVCKGEARRVTSQLAEEIGKSEAGEVSWNKILEVTDHDELVYKLTLKYLREKGYDIGNNKNPRVKVDIFLNNNCK
jgi:hypothetical protein